MFQTLDTIRVKPVKRIRTRMDGIDWLYGLTRRSDCSTCSPDNSVWGLPVGAISLWSGKSGIGKSRLAIELARQLSRLDFRVLYFQNEMPKETFVSKIKSDKKPVPRNFYVSESDTLKNQLLDIRKSRAQIVFIDSINMLEEFGIGSDSSIKKIIQGSPGQEGYRDICTETGCHVIFLCQETKDGTSRGSSTLPHLVDIVFDVGNDPSEHITGGGSEFYLKVNGKHRFGKTGGIIVFDHNKTGVEWLVIRTDDLMKEDYDWCMTNPNYTFESFEMLCEKVRAAAGQRDIAINKHNLRERRKTLLCKGIAGFIWLIFVVIGYAILAILGGIAGGIASTYDKK